MPLADVEAGSLLARVLAGVAPGESPLTHVASLPARSAVSVDWPGWVAPEVRDAFVDQGVRRPWSHQAAAASTAWAGQHVVLATGTASGKSLGYQLPVLSTLATDSKATALYLSPTKALGADQLRAVSSLGLDDVRAAPFDGDTSQTERDWARAHGRWLFSNPDMLHRSLLPRHTWWASYLRRLRYVVLDECHSYRGLFGSHVALLLRRLRRLCALYGSSPTFVLASATVSEPASSASRLTGLPMSAVTQDGSPRGARTVALWEPPLLEELTGENGAPVRRSAGSEAASMLTDLVIEGARTLAFVRSRAGAEVVALRAARALAEVDPDLASRVAAYRAGFLPEERRALERALVSGSLLGVASTNALELGVDIAGLDAVLVAGFPGTRASFWQQAGRAGRAGRDALVVLVARDDPLDTYLVHHPSALLGKPVEGCVLDPTNPYVLGPQLACAAAESPITEAEVSSSAALFGEANTRDVLDSLVADGTLRKRPTGWYWPLPAERPAGFVDIRGGGGGQVAVVESDTGRMLGTVDWSRAPATVHPGAVYLHRGVSFVVDELNLDDGLALVHPEEPDWSTWARSVVEVAILSQDPDSGLDTPPGAGTATGGATRSPSGAPDVIARPTGGVTVQLGDVTVTSQVVSYLRKRPSGEVIETVPLDMPEQSLRTRAVWYTIDESLLADAGLDAERVPGSLHAAEHAAIGLLPLFAVCDRWDIGGMSTALHPDTGAPTVFVHDGHPGGAGFAERGHHDLLPWLSATRDAIADCECRFGCPSCVQSPKCGNGNNPLDKDGAVLVLDIVLGALGRARGDITDRRTAEPTEG
ncbi:DEAD/DEAH box helicase [Pseudonocardia spinosispora]|uniref:DEAD/DEAH box helicase n=1 Tax=Pseudonocardia spinosispora TaxID=103441 RepID=UPI00040E8716|nr:DEAD/DEAH box helicase [Pseudonocardia spinosispora]